MKYNRIKKIQFWQWFGLVLVFTVGCSAGGYGQDSQSALADFYQGNVSTEDINKTTAPKLKTVVVLKKGPQNLVSALQSIARQTGLKLSYSEQVIPHQKIVTIKKAKLPAEQALWDILEGTSYRFGISASGQLVLVKMQRPSPPSQQETITGTVTDGQSGETLPGVNILVKGTTTGTSTDSEGNFELTVPSLQDTLVVSFIGYQTTEVPIQARTEISIEMQSKAISGEEMIVVGYATVEKKDLTGSISSVGTESLQEVNVTNVEQALAGKISGVQVKQYSGRPGTPPEIIVRGVGSMTGGKSPLYVVDGLPVSDLTGINPGTIQNIDILKGASATAIYGSRGSNGVVIVTTKRGQSGATQYSLNISGGLQRLAHKPDYMTAEEQALAAYWGAYNTTKDLGGSVEGDPRSWQFPVPQIALDYLENDEPTLAEGGNPTETNIYGNSLPSTDWVDLVTRVAPLQDYQLSAAGGSENFQFAVTGGYRNQNGIVLNSSFQRFSLRSNFDAQLSEKLEVHVNLSPSYTERTGADPSGTGYGYGAISNAIAIPAYTPAYTPSGDYFALDGYEETGNYPNALTLANEITDNRKEGRLIGNITADYSILDELTVNIMLGGGFSSYDRRFFEPQLSSLLNANPTGQEWRSFDYRWINQYTFNYNQNFGQHQIIGLAGFSAEKNRSDPLYISSQNFPSNVVPYLSATGGIINDGTSSVEEWSLLSYFGRLNYSYKDKYLLTLTGRYDGSSRFGSNNRYGFFPSAALAWRISEEDFLQDLSFLSNLKLRASYGITGNNNIGNYSSLAVLNNITYPFGGSPRPGYIRDNLSRPNLTWESQSSLNLGLDVGFFSDRLNLTVNYYNTRNKDLLLNVNVPSITGFDTDLQNIGEVENEGFELEVSSDNIRGNFGWSTNFNVSSSENKVLALGPEGDPIISDNHITRIGEPIGMFYGLEMDGIFETTEELNEGPIYNPGAPNETRVGDIKFKDFSGPNGTPDGIINSYDRVIMGSPHPDFIYGMTNRFSYQNFSLSVSLQGVVGNEIYSQVRVTSLRSSFRRKLLGEVNNYWISEDRPGDGVTPRLHDEPTGGIREPSTYFLDNGTYLRVNNITLSYAVPINIAQKLNLNSARIYANTTNPFLFSTTSGFNPDVTIPENALTPGEDNNQYPLAKSVNVGIDVSF